jgi:hypothetical protein
MKSSCCKGPEMEAAVQGQLHPARKLNPKLHGVASRFPEVNSFQHIPDIVVCFCIGKLEIGKTLCLGKGLKTKA